MESSYRNSAFFSFGKMCFFKLKHSDDNRWFFEHRMTDEEMAEACITPALSFMRMVDPKFPALEIELEFEKERVLSLKWIAKKGGVYKFSEGNPVSPKPDNFDPVTERINQENFKIEKK